MKTKQESIRVARKALHLYELGQKEDARRLAKRVSWRTLFLAAYADHYADYSVLVTDKLKGIES